MPKINYLIQHTRSSMHMVLLQICIWMVTYVDLLSSHIPSTFSFRDIIQFDGVECSLCLEALHSLYYSIDFQHSHQYFTNLHLEISLET